MPSPESTPARPLDALEATIRQRAEALQQSGGAAEKSWTVKLLAGDLELISGKVVEEAGELVEAAAELEAEGAGTDQHNTARTHLIAEAGDLLYHTLVLLRREGVDLAEVETELAKRFGVSGIEEKASRSK